MLLPIEKLAEDVGIVLDHLLGDVVLEVELHASPLDDLWVVLVGYQAKDFLAEFRDAEVSICAEDFCEGSFVLRALSVEGVEGKTQQLIQEHLVNAAYFLFLHEWFINDAVRDELLLFLLETHVAEVELASFDEGNEDEPSDVVDVWIFYLEVFRDFHA